VQTVAAPIITLGDISTVEVETGVVMLAEVVGVQPQLVA